MDAQVYKTPLFWAPISFLSCPYGALELGHSTGLFSGTWIREHFRPATHCSGPVAPVVYIQTGRDISSVSPAKHGEPH